MASTDWRETIPADEEERFLRYANEIRELQRAATARWGAPGRGLHRKPHGGFHAEFRVLPDLPAELRAGLFAAPKTFHAVVRFSNGSQHRQADRTGDVRGLAVKVLGVDGKKALGNARTQDFLAIPSSATPFRTADEFVAFVRAASGSQALLFPRFARDVGLSRALKILPRLAKGVSVPPASLAGITYYSALPVRWGAHAARYSFAPATPVSAPPPDKSDREYLMHDLVARVKNGPLEWEMRAQLFADESTTPIEDASIDWPTPWVKVGTLTIPAQDAESAPGRALAERVESMSFDPWHALEEHRPLGNFMRARKHAYFSSTQERRAAPEPEGDSL
ncbi:MAG TPA: catalase [bacterium]|nr:catalase [bacterium]